MAPSPQAQLAGTNPTNYQKPAVEDEDPANAQAPNNNNNSRGEGDDIPSEPKKLHIHFRDQHNTQLEVVLKPTTALGKAMEAYASRIQRTRSSLRFLFEGQRVLDEHTPLKLDMDGGCVIDVFEEQIGGAAAAGWTE